MSELVLEAKPPQRTDIACKNCLAYDRTRPHSVGNHATDPPGCREKLEDGTRCPCPWVPTADGQTGPAKKLSLGDFT